ncbi:Bifunctional dethiobiotin synthetase/7,8-diamino-pelargonic acid aminotransferase, mitochondrial [Asimina triloba]
MALLHGHSYSAHAMGCTAASKAIQWFKDPLSNLNIIPGGRQLRELWDNKLVLQISYHPEVQRVVALGTLFALELRAEGSNAGYASLYASSLVQKLRTDEVLVLDRDHVYTQCCLGRSIQQYWKPVTVICKINEFGSLTGSDVLPANCFWFMNFIVLLH